MKSKKLGIPRLIGVIHLKPLPGSAGAQRAFPGKPYQALQAAMNEAIKEAKLYDSLGLDGIMVENFGDVPFFASHVPAETIASMARITGEIVSQVRIPVGVNVLRNDFLSAIGIAATSRAEFIRINVLSGVAATDQGIIEGKAADWIRERNRLCPDVQILADVMVKHAKSLSVSEIDLAIEEVGLRAHANGIIVTGPTTGRSMERSYLKKAYDTAQKLGIPLWVGSGTTVETASWMIDHADGFIIGSAFRKDGKAGAPLDPARIKSLLKKL